MILWIPGFVGVLTFLLLDLQAIIAMMPEPPEQSVVLPPAVLQFLSLLQPAVLLSIAVGVGMALAGKVGLHSPAAEAGAATGVKDYLAALMPQAVPGIVAGIASGVAIICVWVAAKPFLSPAFIVSAEAFNKVVPNAVRFLYGGITEELLLRWGVMTFFVWAFWRLLQKGDGPVKGLYVIASILISALLFAAGHLPVASILGGGLDLPTVIFVMAGNSIFGIVAGFLYWKRGLESAMIAHIITHVVLVAAMTLAM